MTRPLSGFSKPAMMSSNVDLPQPLGPTMTMNSPSATSGIFDQPREIGNITQETRCLRVRDELLQHLAANVVGQNNSLPRMFDQFSRYFRLRFFGQFRDH